MEGIVHLPLHMTYGNIKITISSVVTERDLIMCSLVVMSFM